VALSAKEKKMLEALQAKAEEPDHSPTHRTANYSIDLSDSKAVALAKKLGLLGDDDDDDDDDDEDEGKEETPKRKGFFD
jgi:hypothetical protein